MFVHWSTYSALSLGAFALWSRDLSFVPLVLLLGYPAILGMAVREIRDWRDMLNPLSFLLLLSVLRYSLPAFLIMLNGEPDVETFRLMQLQEADWQMGHLLALCGMLGTAVGWLMISARSSPVRPIRFQLPYLTSHTAVTGMALGLFSLVLFVALNGTLAAAIEEGSFRHTSIRVGTGILFYLSLGLISSSVLLSSYLLRRGAHSWRTSLAPVGLAAAFFFILGGRVRSAVPVIAVLLLLWYMSRERMGWNDVYDRRFVKWGVVALVVGLWFGNLGQLYRGGLGLRALTESFSITGVSEYAEDAIFEDVGQLHALAGATSIGPGRMELNTFLGAITWPLPDLLDLPQGSAGAFIVEDTMGFVNDDRWGFHASLMGDAYLNFGVPGMVLVVIVFGALMKLLYVSFRSGRLRASIYVLAAVYCCRIFLESVEKWGELATVFVLLYAAIEAARLLFGEARTTVATGMDDYAHLARRLQSPRQSA